MYLKSSSIIVCVLPLLSCAVEAQDKFPEQVDANCYEVSDFSAVDEKKQTSKLERCFTDEYEFRL